jgi:two-component system CheB/CheR fusion protein
MGADDSVTGRREADPDGTVATGAPRAVRLVGVGASAGGLKALKGFFEAIPGDSGLTYVVIVHLDPDHDSQMASLLQSKSKIPVTQISSTFTPEPNRAYVIPPNGNLSAVDGGIELTPRDRNSPIDFFFRTLAHAYGPDAIGVVLSGTGSDGTAGLRWIRDAGGITIAQTPGEAEYDAMPKNAIASGHVDLVLPVHEIPPRLSDLAGEEPHLRASGEADQQDTKPTAAMSRIIAVLRRHTNHDFSGYKRPSLMRRLRRRMRFQRISSLSEYAHLLLGDSTEVDRLFHDLLISVSGFFRDTDAFAALEREVIPKLFDGKGPDDQVRVWVAGCATGEEAYSIAILLLEHAATLTAPPRIQVFATDVDDDACRRARTGTYPATVGTDISPERLAKFFESGADGLHVNETLRERVLFASHDLLRDPPFSRLDLVSCRNVLIYLNAEAQRRVLKSFHYALLPGGYVFLGGSEFTGDDGLFAPVDAKHRIYRRLAPGLPRQAHPIEFASPKLRRAEATDPAKAVVPGFAYGPLHLRMLEAYAPPSVIVDANATVVHLSQLAGRYVRLPGGVPTTNLFDMVSGDLRLELRAALREALEKGGAELRTVRTDIDGLPRIIDVHVSPLEVEGRTAYALIVFAERLDVEKAIAGDAAEVPGGATIARLEQEVHRAREQLGASLEEREITVEELRSTNEELQSINEQHRTALEEMETSQEELQSLNEELTTVNQEHHATIDELKLTTADLTNLVSAINLATIFLDRELRVRRFSPEFATIFNLTPPDHGRPLSHVTHGLQYDTLTEDAQRVLASIEPLEREVRDHTGKWYSVRIRPYRSMDDRIEGVVITFYDVTEAHRYREAEHDARTRAEAQTIRLEALMRQMPAGVLVVDVPSGRILSANDRAHEIWGDDGLPEAASLGHGNPLVSAFRPDGKRYGPDEWPVSRMIRTGRVVRDEEVELEFADGRRSVLLVNAAPAHDGGGAHRGGTTEAIVTFLDVTNRKRMEEDLRTATKEAERANRAKGLFMSTLSHEFRTPLNGILGYADLLARDQRLDEQQRRRADRIQAAVRHLAIMVEQILGLAGLDEEPESVTMTTLDARVTARAAADMCEPVATAAGLTLRMKLPDDPASVITDHNRLRMILVNLLGNAIKFTEHGEIGLDVRLEGDRAAFVVHDTGIGIAPENHELIFERFFQVSKGLTRSAGGVGIGLSAAQEFSRMLGGEIEIESELGRGSTFTLWLPLTPPVVVPPPPRQRPRDRQA